MTTFLSILLAGSFAALFMISLMYSLIWRGFRHGDLIRVIGASFVTKRRGRSYFRAGLSFYLVCGLILSPIYFAVLSLLQFEGILANAGFGLFLGFSQGFILTQFFLEEFPDYQAPNKYRRFNLPVTLAHWFGHMGYGFTLGAMLGAYLSYPMRGFLVALATVLVSSLVMLVVSKTTRAKLY